MRIREVALLATLFLCGAGRAQTADFTHPDLLSFEQSTAPLTAEKGSKINLSKSHYKHGTKSVRWQWNHDSAQLKINAPIDYLAKNPNPRETSVSTFVFWVYAPKSLDATMRVEFLKQGRICSWFDYKLQFQGWRGGWLAFDRDMQGNPEEGMDQVVITVNGVKKGELYLDHWILSSFQDARQHTADFQAPYINPDTDSHWLTLLHSWNNPLEMELQSSVSPSQQAGIDSVQNRLERMLLSGEKATKPEKLETLRQRVKAYSITKNSDKTLRGKPIHFIRYAETYINMGDDYTARTKSMRQNQQLLQQCNDLLMSLAASYHATTINSEKEEISKLYISLLGHLLDQGFAAGSAQGTLHHLGYSMRNFYTSPILMRDAIARAGFDQRIQQAMEWFSGAGEVKLAPKIAGIDIDAFNTSLIGRLASILMMRDTPQKVAYLKAFSRWADNGYKYTEGTSPCFKSDGTLFHHRHHYPAYAIGGFDGGVRAIYLLHNTDFAISQESHQNQKRALLEMRFYCNRAHFPLALSGRHPDGKGKLSPWHYSKLAHSGSPDRSESLDRELASAYMRLSTPQNKDYQNFASQGIEAEPSPQGARAYGYNASISQRRGDWLLTAAGHSRYLWAAETYQNANHYGRYLTHGSLQLLNGSKSGFQTDGWDWRHIPGTTAAAIPMEELKADIRNVDTFSGYEEMLLSDQTFAGSVDHLGRNGAFGMVLHEHDKYNGSLRARKSVFLFDNRAIALGSGIENAKSDSQVHTTIFQSHIASPSDSITVDGRSVTLPFAQTSNGGTLRDNLGTAYFIPRGDLNLSLSRQQSLHEENDSPTQGDFATAWINHGEVIKDGQYEYMMVVEPTSKQLEEYSEQLPYKILSHNNRAHIVRDKQTQTTGYVLFEAGKVADSVVRNVSQPALVMVSQDQGTTTISLCDPDLRLYQGPSDEIYDQDGKRIERSIYSRDWIDNPSIPSIVELTINGRWALTKSTPDCTLRHDGEETILSFNCREAATRQAQIKPINIINGSTQLSIQLR